MDEQPSIERFESSEALIAELRTRLDDIEEIVIPVQEGIEFVSPQGQRTRHRGVGGIVRLCTGEQIALHRDDAAMLINDGVLQRLKLKCRLDPLPKD